jgi:YesN/AraC family two-component response regulator
MDIVMPRMNGVDAAKKMYELDPTIRIILSSGFSNSLADGVKADAFLAKPYRIKVLYELILKVLEPRLSLALP